MLKISIIIPVYNVEKYLAECLESVINQSYANIEIICVNDGSTDSSPQILQLYAKKDERIRVISQSNHGLSMARNTGIEHATGEYICFLDSDDMLVETAADTVVKALESALVDVLVFNANLIYENEHCKRQYNITEYFKRKGRYSEIVSGQEMFVNMMKNNDFCIAACLLIVKREWLLQKKIKFYPGIIHEDNMFCVQCYLGANTVKYINESLYIYRIRENSITTKKADELKLYSLMINYEFTLRELFSDKYQEAVKEQLNRYMDGLLYSIRLVDNELFKTIGRKTERIKGFEMEALCKSLQIGKYHSEEYDEYVYMEGFKRCIENSNGIILYGAGEIGKLVHGYLCKQGDGQRIKAFVVTEKVPEDSSYMGTKIYALEQLEEEIQEKEYLVVIAVGKKYQSEIKDLCREKKLNRVILINNVLKQNMSSSFLRKS